MSASHSNTPADPNAEVDAIDSIIPLMPIVLPVAGGVLMFLLAFIAVYMT